VWRQKLDQTKREYACLRRGPPLAIRFPNLRSKTVYRLFRGKLSQASGLLPGIDVFAREYRQDAWCHIGVAKRSEQKSIVLRLETRKFCHFTLPFCTGMTLVSPAFDYLLFVGILPFFSKIWQTINIAGLYR